MAQSLQLVKEFGKINSIYGLSSPKNIATQNGTSGTSITQTGSATSGVTLTTNTGVIVTTSVATATLGSFSFIASNSNIDPTSVVITGIQGYTGTGIPVVSATSVTTGSFTVVVNNVHPTSPLSAGMRIAYEFF